jgi:hypothetical protein
MSDNPRDVTQFSSNLAYISSPLVKCEDNVAYGIGLARQPQVNACLLLCLSVCVSVCVWCSTAGADPGGPGGPPPPFIFSFQYPE